MSTEAVSHDGAAAIPPRARRWRRSALGGISRYLFVHFGVATIAAVVFLCFAVWLTQSLRLISFIVNTSADLGLFAWLVMLSMPEMLVAVLPIAMVIALIFGFMRLKGDSEMTVIGASGMGPWQLAWPAIALSVLLAGLTLFLTLYLWPMANREYREMRHILTSEFSFGLLREGRFNTIDDDITIYFTDRIGPNRIENILIQDERTEGRRTTITASAGVVFMQGGAPSILVTDGLRQELDVETDQMNELAFAEYILAIQEPVEGGSTWREHDERFITDLLWPDMTNEGDVRSLSRLIAEGHKRLTTPMMSLGFAFIMAGVMLSGPIRRTGSTGRVWVAVGIVVVAQAAFLGVTGAANRNNSLIMFSYLLPAAMVTAGTILLTRASIRQAA